MDFSKSRLKHVMEYTPKMSSVQTGLHKGLCKKDFDHK